MATDHRKPWHGRLNARPPRYWLAIGVTALATGARYALDPILGDTAHYLTFYLAAILVATIGGRGPGFLVTGLGSLLGMWLFVEPRGVLSLDTVDLVRLLAFLTVGTGVSLLGERLHVYRRSAAAQLGALRASEAFARQVLASSLSGLYMFDLPGRTFSYISPQYTRLTGYTLDRLQAMGGDGVLTLFHPEDREKVAAHIAAAGRVREDEVREIEYRFKTADGRWIWCLSRETAFERGSDGEVRRYLGSFLDVTRRKEAEETRRKSESFYRQTLESIPGMVFTTRPDGFCDYQSQQWVDYTGVPMSEHLGDGWNTLLHPEDQPRAAAAWRAAVSGEAPYDLEYRVRRRDGHYEWFKVIGRPIHDEEGRVVKWLGVALNIGDLKRAEEALAAARISAERARAAAEEASAAKDHFLAVLSHELRTPLSPVVSGISLLESEKTLSERGRSILTVVRRNVELESRLIDDLLDLTRVARGKVELDKRPVELCTIIDRAIEVCRPDIEARGLHFGVDYGPRPYLVDADAARLQQVFWNLLKNAIKFTPVGGCVGLCCRPDDGVVAVEVSDSGIGIERADLTRIFDAFAQAERSLKRQFGGLGLGLAISKALVEMHGGGIEAHSRGLNMGTTFRVRLPLVSVHREDDHERAMTFARVPDGGRRPLRVLVVEDHGDSADLLAAVLESDGHEVVKAADVATALDVVSGARFDLLLSDLGLPDRSGLELIREVRSRGLGIPAFALSGYGQEQDVERSRTAGFSHHFIKPVDPSLLLEAIQRHVRSEARAAEVRHHEGPADLEG